MTKLIRKRCPKCKNVDIYKRVTFRDLIEKSRSSKVIKFNVPSKLYHCCKCGNEFNIPFVGSKE